MIIEVSRADAVAYRHCLETHAREIDELAATWSHFTFEDWDFRTQSQTAAGDEALAHGLASGSRFFSRILGLDEASPTALPPDQNSPPPHSQRLPEAASLRANRTTDGALDRHAAFLRHIEHSAYRRAVHSKASQ